MQLLAAEPAPFGLGGSGAAADDSSADEAEVLLPNEASDVDEAGAAAAFAAASLSQDGTDAVLSCAFCFSTVCYKCRAESRRGAPSRPRRNNRRHGDAIFGGGSGGRDDANDGVDDDGPPSVFVAGPGAAIGVHVDADTLLTREEAEDAGGRTVRRKQQRDKKRKREQLSGSGTALPSTAPADAGRPGACYHPVLCDICDTEVGVAVDVATASVATGPAYLFFNVVPGHG